jgi:hypothetical protein
MRFNFDRYARATMAAMHYLLRTRGLSSVKSKCMRVALRAQFLEMVRNDLQYVCMRALWRRMVLAVVLV